MAYALENAVADLRAENPWLLETVDFEPLEGITDGVNKVFRTPHKPLDEASGVTIYTQDGSEVGSSYYTMVSWNGGVLRFDNGVSAQYYADYSVADPFYSQAKLKDLCEAGFREMMNRWPQSWYLIDSGGSTYISSTTPSITDPPIGGVTFSTSHQSLNAFLECCEYKLAQARYRKASAEDVDYREGMSGGVAVTTHHRTKALADLVESLNKKIDADLSILEEVLTGEGYGAFVSGAKSNAYEEVYEWWDDSDQASGT